MCVILATNKNFKPDLATLKACERANPHGGSIAWISGDRVRWQKAITAEEVHAVTKRERGPFVIHFRIASVGAVCPELCHPFPVSGNASLALTGSAHTVLFQNGTWHDWEDTVARVSKRLHAKLPEGPFSDARAAAWFVAQLGQPAFRIMGGKFITMNKTGWTIQKGDWFKHAGFVTSNNAWQSRGEPRRYCENDLDIWNAR